MRRRSLLFVVALALSGLACEKAPCDVPYSCPYSPDGGPVTIDCMPPSDGSPECSGQCHAWLTEHCPDVRFVF